MKKNKLSIILIAVLCVFTAVLAIVHLATRKEETDGAVQIVHQGGENLVYISDITTVVDVDGTVVNNAGETKTISGKGISVYDMLVLAGVDPNCDIKITSADEYTVELTAEEISEAGKAWLLLQEDNTLRLIVFGDDGARRNVKGVARITVIY